MSQALPLQRSSPNARADRAPPPPARRGVVLLLVLSAVVVAGIIAYGILAAASIESQTSVNARAALQAESMAENGVNLAMHYLLRPQDSPVALVQGGAGDWHYPGQGPVFVGEDSFVVSVINLSPGKFRILATGKSRDADGNVTQRQLRVRVVGVGGWAARGAAQFSRDVKLDPDVLINADLVVNGEYDGGGTVIGKIYATNPPPGETTWGDPPEAPEVVVPAFSKLNLVRAVNENSGYYVYNNTRCRADYIIGNTLLLPPIPSLGNPGNVFVYTGSGTLTLGGLLASTFNGTLILTQGDLLVNQNWTISPKSKMPALLVAGDTRLEGAAGKLVVNGLYYAGDGFGSSNTTAANPVTVYGVTLCATSSGTDFGSGVPGALAFYSDAVKADVPDLTDQGIRYSRLQIEDWEQVN